MRQFVQDIESRLANRVQLTTDQLSIYLRAVNTALRGEVDYAMLQKLYAGGQCSPAPEHFHIVRGTKQPHDADAHSPLYALTNAFSKKVEMHAYAVAIHFHVVQLRQAPRDVAYDASNGGGCNGPALGGEDIVALLNGK